LSRRAVCYNRLQVRTHDSREDFIIRARIHYVEDRLVELTNGTAYCRESDRSRRLSEAEKQEIRINKGERAFELEQCALSFPDDFRAADLARFARQIRQVRDGSVDVSDIQIFESMRLGKSRGGSFRPQ